MISPKKLFSLFKEAVMAWVDDYAPSMGAAISYYTMFSLAPMLIIVIAVAGAVFGREAVQGQIVAQISDFVGKDGATMVQSLLKSASDSDKGLVAGIISLVVLIIGATTVFAELQSALDRIWHVPESAKPSGIWATLRARVLSFGLILGLAFLLMVSLVLSAGIAAAGSWATGMLPGYEVLLQVVNIGVSLVISTLLFAMIFKYMTTADLRWADVWIGAAVTALLFEIGKFAISFYLGKSGVNESFAAAGSLVVLLAWVYYAAQIFLLGAEFTKVYANYRGSNAGAKAVAATEAKASLEKAGTDADPQAIAAGVNLDKQPQADRAGDVPDYAGLGATERAQREIDKRVQAAASRLLPQLAVLAATTLLSTWSARYQKKQRLALRQAEHERKRNRQLILDTRRRAREEADA
ncbi:MAG: YihY/virulence factor BrkB family protein [Variovorax sp.]